MSPRPRERKARGCPVCGQPPDEAFKPFCCRHCADLDLARWLGGGYAIPAEEAEDGAPESGGEGESEH